LKQQFNPAKTFRGCPDLLWKCQFYGSAEKIYGSVLNSQNALKDPDPGYCKEETMSVWAPPPSPFAAA